MLAAAVAFATTRESGSAQPRSLTVVPKNSVAVIDPDTTTVVDAIPIGSRPSGIAVGAGDVWVGAFEDESVIRIDPQIAARDTSDIDSRSTEPRGGGGRSSLGDERGQPTRGAHQMHARAS